MVMAAVAGDDGICWASQKRLIDETLLSERGVRDSIRRLEELGEIETRHAQRGRKRINVYRLWCSEEPDYERLPFVVDTPFSRPATSAGRGVDDRQLASPRPADRDRDDRQIAAPTPSLDGKSESKKRGPTWRIDRQVVTESEEQFAREVLATWNASTGQTLTNRDWLSMITRRQREHPALELGDHEAVIQAALGSPWWQGSPAPNVVYGSGAQFERSLTVRSQPSAATKVEEERSRFARILGGNRQ
jgi:hypothetical protein